MWRALFLAIGISLCILGGECLFLEKAVLARAEEPNAQLSMTQAPPREIAPPEWAPWTLMSAGAVVLLYSFSIPKRVGS